jgi:hypothetical protein
MEPAPRSRGAGRQRQRVLTARLLFVIAVLLGVITPMLLKRFFFVAAIDSRVAPKLIAALQREHAREGITNAEQLELSG